MLYFKHAELTEKYHVSLKTVHNWIDAAKQGKLELDLHNHNGRVYIANKPGNVTLLEKLTEQGKKYRNSRFHKVVTPTAEFYELFSKRQILDIVSNLTIHHEIPRQYNYFDGGASNWDMHVERLWNEDGMNLPKSSAALLAANESALDLLLKDYDRVNIIDIGPGNGIPVKGLLEHFVQNGKLHRYLAIDISQDMLGIVKRNMQTWFNNTLNAEYHLRDITHERFDDLLVDDMFNQSAGKIANLVLFLGATPMNLRNPMDALKVIYNSMGQEDLLIYTDKPDSPAERRYFNFSPDSTVTKLFPIHRVIFDLLNIDASLYDVEMGFDLDKHVRYIRVRMNTSLSITFKVGTGERTVDINKGETILLWRAWHMTALEIITQFDSAGFALLQSSMTKDRQYLMTISGINVDSDSDS